MHTERLAVAGGDLALYRWAPAGAPRAHLTLCHGYLEHAGRYAQAAGALARAGIEVWAFDLRGHGRSFGARGAVERFDDYVSDLLAVAARVPGGRPHFWLGHSLGGLVALSAARRHAGGPTALVLTNPFLRLAAGRRGLMARLAPLVGRLAPTLRVAAGIASEDLTSDPAEASVHRADPDIQTHATSGWALAASRGQAALDHGPLLVACPVLWVVGEADPVADPDASVAAFARLQAPHKVLWRRPDDRHEVLHERGREALLRDLVAWLDAYA